MRNIRSGEAARGAARGMTAAWLAALSLAAAWPTVGVADNVLRNTPSGLTDGRTPSELLGGNVNTRTNQLQNSLDAIDFYAEMNLGMVRVALNPGSFWVGGINNPTPDPTNSTTETIIDYAVSRGLEPYMLINYRPVIHGGDWNDFSQQDWYDLGRAFALEYQDRVDTYTFINEPENFDALIDPNDYATSLESFADGVHSVSTALKVSTGGFATIANVNKTQGFLQAIAPLVESGDLYALNIHTYNSLTNSARIISDGTNDAAPNSIFADQKAIAGITSNVAYSAAEWNLRNTNDANDDLAAADFLTAMWDHLGVVGSGGNNDHVVDLATVFQLRLADPTKGHALADSLDPVWDGNERGDVFEMVVDLVHDAAFTEVRPIDDGYFILEKQLEKKVWVLQNRTGWRTEGSTATTTIADIPAWATDLEVWYWDGMASTTPLAPGTDQLTLPVRPEETAMIIAVGNLLAGDYNFDQVVDAADFAVWRESVGATGPAVPADGNRDGVVDSLDFDLWAQAYGQPGPATAVPEPAALAIAAMALLFVACRRRC